MSKDKRHSDTAFKQVHRQMLKTEGKCHLPSNKVEAPMNTYKRIKSNKTYFLKYMED